MRTPLLCISSTAGRGLKPESPGAELGMKLPFCSCLELKDAALLPEL